MENVMMIRQIAIDGKIVNTDNITPRETLKLLHKYKPFNVARVYAFDGWIWDYTTKNNRIIRL